MTVTKTEAIAYLSEYRDLQFHEDHIEEQMFSIYHLIRDLERDLPQTSTRTQRRIASAKKHFLAELSELKLRHARVRFRREHIEAVVASLPSRERRILERYYLYGDPIHAAEDLMEELGYEKAHIYRLRDRALAAVGRRFAENPPFSVAEVADKKTAEKHTDSHR